MTIKRNPETALKCIWIIFQKCDFHFNLISTIFVPEFMDCQYICYLSKCFINRITSSIPINLEQFWHHRVTCVTSLKIICHPNLGELYFLSFSAWLMVVFWTELGYTIDQTTCLETTNTCAQLLAGTMIPSGDIYKRKEVTLGDIEWPWMALKKICNRMIEKGPRRHDRERTGVIFFNKITVFHFIFGIRVSNGQYAAQKKCVN